MKLWRTPLDSGRVQVLRGEVHIEKTWCKGCNYCVEFCPTDVLEMSTEFNSKGYHFPDLTVVGVGDADLGLRGGDLRAGERTYQQLVQVAGRAGRELYDHSHDTEEVTNLAEDPQHAKTVAELSSQLAKYVQLQSHER